MWQEKFHSLFQIDFTFGYHNIDDESDVIADLKACADVISETNEKMLKLRKRLEEAEDIPTEEDVLFDRLRRLDIPIN